jgi:outer membrane autotransporter protein
MAFAAGNGFEVAGLPIARTSAVVELGLEMDLAPRSTLSLDYQGQIASKAQDHGVQLRWNMKF